MFCKNCGKENKEDSKFCTGCGNTILVQETVVNNDYKSGGKKIKGSTIGRIIIGCLIIGWIIYSNVDDTSITTNNNALSSANSGNNTLAIEQLKDASNSAVKNDTKLNTLKNLAYVYSSELKNDLALNSFREALSLAKPASFDYYLISGEIAFLENKPNSAKINYYKALEIKPNDYQINGSLAAFYLGFEESLIDYRDYPKALVFAKKANESATPDVKNITLENLGVAYFFNENYSQAITTFKEITSNNPVIDLWLGLSYAAKDDPINAKPLLRKAIASGEVEIPQEVYDYLDSN
jgi:tetratricopeptide (TPR) repeat protein